MSKIKSAFTLGLFASGCLHFSSLHADVTTGVPILVNIGNTNNPYVSYLTIDDTSLGNSALKYAWYYSGYTETGTTNPLTGTDLLNTVIQSTAGSAYALSYTTNSSGVTTSYTVGATTSPVVDPATTPWAYWVKGGSQYVPYGDNGTFTFNASNLNWVVAPANFDTRWLSNNSYDGWTISPFSYTGVPSDTSYYVDVNGSNQPVTIGTYTGAAPLSAAAVPEPATIPLMLLSLAALIGITRWKSPIPTSKK